MSSSPTWWEQYIAGLRGVAFGWSQSRITRDGLRELDQGTKSIIDEIPDLSSACGWPTGGYRITGVVVGAIQSGKTRSMIGVAARAFDKGFNIIVVLSGLKNDLRSQTSSRFHTDLVQQGEQLTGRANQSAVYSHPKGLGLHGWRKDIWALPSVQDAHEYPGLAGQLIGALNKSEHVLLVVKKQKDALKAVNAALDAVWLHYRNRTVSLMVLDDECDEASVPRGKSARIPKLIANLWANAKSNQPVAYIGYTATPQAAIFQSQSNQLFPSFVKILKAPAEFSSDLEFAESEQSSRYSSTDVYFEWLERIGAPSNWLTEEIPDQEAALDNVSRNAFPWSQSTLAEAVIAYYVSGAIRLLLSDGGIELPGHAWPTHTMLVHTDTEQDAHWQLASAITEICNGHRTSESVLRAGNILPGDRLDSKNLTNFLNKENPRWENWYNSFQNSYQFICRQLGPGGRTGQFPAWAEVEAALIGRVFKKVKLKVINSSSEDDSLDFSKVVDAHGQPQPREDDFTIIVGGNVLSRGLTIEGLAISYFTRWAKGPVDDTVMQRQRWLGYRSDFIEFNRIFTSKEILSGLRRAGNSEQNFRRQIAYISSAGLANIKSTFTFFQGAGQPTGKLGTSRPVRPSFTGTKPFIRRVHTDKVYAQSGSVCLISRTNETRAKQLVDFIKAANVQISGGYLRANITSLQVADYLDGLDYDDHNPGKDSSFYTIFKSIETTYDLKPGTLYRQPDAARPSNESIPPTFDPYLIAAYLRAWHYIDDSITNRGKTNRELGSNLEPWNPTKPPIFNLVYRTGSQKPSPSSIFSDDLTNKKISGELLVASWGRSGTIDEESLDIAGANPNQPRSSGDPGLLMLYILDRKVVGSDQYSEIPTFGVVIPLGGPTITGHASA